MKKLIISIDFDGTIVRDRYPLIGEPYPDAVNTIRTLYTYGHYIIINTCRVGRYFDQMKSFLREWQIPYDTINENNPDRIKKYGGDCRKISADIYIDDKAYPLVHSPGKIDWDDVLKTINIMADDKTKQKTLGGTE